MITCTLQCLFVRWMGRLVCCEGGRPDQMTMETAAQSADVPDAALGASGLGAESLYRCFGCRFSNQQSFRGAGPAGRDKTRPLDLAGLRIWI